MTIAYIGQKGIPATFGGVERHVHDLAVRVAKRGQNVVVYNRPWYTKNTPANYEGVRMVYLPSINTKHLDTATHTLLATLHAIFILKPDIIHYHGVGPALWSWLPRLLSPKTKVITTFHSTDRKHEKWGFIARFMLRLGEAATSYFPHKTIAISQTIKQYIRDVYDREAAYIPNAVPLYTKITSEDILKKFDLQKNKYIVMVSRLVAHKGAQYLIDAFKAAKTIAPSVFKNIKLVIVGDGYYTDAYVATLKAKAVGQNDIVFTGFQSGTPLAELFSHARLMVHPSDNEGLPLTVLEGMSYELPVLVSDIPEHKDLIPNIEYQFAQSNSGALAEKLISILSKPQTERDRAGTDNKKVIVRSFEINHIVDKTILLYEEMLTPQIRVTDSHTKLVY